MYSGGGIVAVDWRSACRARPGDRPLRGSPKSESCDFGPNGRRTAMGDGYPGEPARYVDAGYPEEFLAGGQPHQPQQYYRRVQQLESGHWHEWVWVEHR